MKGITNAPMGAGGSGGDWTQITGNDWSSVFEVVNSQFHVKKDVLFVFNDTATLWTNPFSTFIPKGTTSPVAYFSVNFGGSAAMTANKLRILTAINLNSSAITSASLDVSVRDYTFNTDGSSVSINTTSTNATLSKTKISLYTRD